MAAKVLGHIDCPICGTAKGVRITHDKNGHPFGYCEAECNQQIRIGGNERRVAAFIARHPWAAGPVTDTAAPPPAAETTPKPAKKPVTVTAPAPVPQPAVTPPPPARTSKPGPFDFLINPTPKATA